MDSKLKEALATAGYTGYCPFIPGTAAASLMTLIGGVLYFLFADKFQLFFGIASIIGIIVSVYGHYALYEWSCEKWNSTDSSHFVLDEIFGQAITYLGLVFFDASPTCILIYGLIAFRVFDIIKFPGAKEIDQHIHTAKGALYDDLVSALYAIALFQPFLLVFSRISA